MAGQMIVLAGVNSGAAANGKTIKMTSADQIAAKIPSLAYAITPPTLTKGSDGLLTGRDRASGALLTTSGVAANQIIVSAMGGHLAVNTGGNIVSAALRLPAGTATPSYSVIQAVYLGGVTVDSATSLFNPSIIMGLSAQIAAPIRYYGLATNPGDPTYRGQLISGGSNGSAPFARLAGPTVKGWAIVTSCYDNSTKQLTLGLNGVTSHSVTKDVGLVIDSNSYWCLGYPLSPSGFVDSGVGDSYIFNDSLQSTPYGRERLSALVSAMKTAYGIA